MYYLSNPFINLKKKKKSSFTAVGQTDSSREAS